MERNENGSMEGAEVMRNDLSRRRGLFENLSDKLITECKECIPYVILFFFRLFFFGASHVVKASEHFDIKFRDGQNF